MAPSSTGFRPALAASSSTRYPRLIRDARMRSPTYLFIAASAEPAAGMPIIVAGFLLILEVMFSLLPARNRRLPS